MIEVDGPDVDVSYVTARRPFREADEMPDYEIELYQQLAPGVAAVRGEAQTVADAVIAPVAVGGATTGTNHATM